MEVVDSLLPLRDDLRNPGTCHYAKYFSVLMLNIFQVPHLDSFHTGWLYCALAGACVFLLVQMVLVTQSARYLCEIFFCFDAKCFFLF